MYGDGKGQLERPYRILNSLEEWRFCATKQNNRSTYVMSSYPDIPSIISQVRSGKQGRDKVICMLYRDEHLKQQVISYIRRNSGNEDDAEQVWTTVVMQTVKSMATRLDLEIKNTLEHYMMGVARYTWLSMLKKQKPSQVYDQQLDVDMSPSVEEAFIGMERVAELEELMQVVGEKCREVLHMWSHSYSMAEIAKAVGYKSEMMAKKKKYKCLQRLITYLHEHPHLKDRLK